MAKEWEVEGLTPGESFHAAAAKIILTKSAEMWHYAPGTIAGDDIEELHSMRVSSRRLRAAVDACAPCFTGKTYARFQRVISGLTEELGAVRDADVMLEALAAERKRASADERPGIDDLIAQVRTRREQARPAMLAHLAALEADDFRRQFETFVRDEA
ncbi:MAG: CHAD domain-containing protein, partial [Chloroflexi bacterium]|nr:CHAD domain-containing protein [Chloroflexota bacterium]